MIQKAFPRPFRTRLLSKIRYWILPPLVTKYLPYHWGHDTYALPKPTRVPEATAESIVPIQRLWGGFWKDRTGYLESGRLQVEAMRKAMTDSGFDLDGCVRILDYGCGAGRMIRHLAHVAEEGEVWGLDIEAEAIYWCKQHLSPPFRFATTTTIPHLPFEDRYFDAIYARSVFTHIDDLAEAWLLELRRVLRPGGRLYITIHDERTVELFEEAQFADHPLARAMRTSDELQPFKDGAAMLVIGRDAFSQVFYNRDYFCEMARQTRLEVLSVSSDGYGYQTAILLARAAEDRRIELHPSRGS